MFEWLAIAPELKKYMDAGISFYLSSSSPPTVEAVTTFLHRLSAGWNPTIQGQTFLDDPGTRAAGVRFLAGIAVRIASTQGKNR